MVNRVLLQGGLGNQLFQVAAGIYLREKLKQNVVFDSTLLTKLPKGVRLREVEVDWLLNSDEFSKGSLRTLGLVALERYFPKFVLKEKDLNHEILTEVKSDFNILNGYFQNSNYADFSWSFLKEKLLSKMDYCFPRELLGQDYVALHFRGGDYLNDKHTRDSHGVTGFNYFKSALGLIRSQTNLDTLLIVTDTPSHIDKNVEEFKDFETKIVSSENLYVDLSIISKAKSVVMSNSSFSWWGAFIADKTLSAQIVAPKPWFNGKIQEPKKLIPKHWTVLERDIFQ
jgi:hypothetical protein